MRPAPTFVDSADFGPLMSEGRYNHEKIILDLCGGTGSWSKPYRDAGYDVRVVTLPGDDLFTWQPPTEPVYGVLFAPTCTEFSLAKNTPREDRNLRESMRLVMRGMEIIHECQYNGKLRFWAMENPTGLLRQFMGVPQFVFDPCDFGDNHTKKTDLWGYFNHPLKQRRQLTEAEVLACRQRLAVAGRNIEESYIKPDGWSWRQVRRSMTSPYFANAFYKANR